MESPSKGPDGVDALPWAGGGANRGEEETGEGPLTETPLPVAVMPPIWWSVWPSDVTCSTAFSLRGLR